MSMRIAKRSRLTLSGGSLFGVSILILVGCAPSAQGPDSDAIVAEDQSIVIGLSDEPAALRAGADQAGVGFFMNTLIHRGLMAYSNEGELVNGLAAEVETVNPAEYHFILREGLTFQDGSPLTSSDVKSSLLWYADPAHAARTVGAMSGIESIETPDDLTVVIKLAENNTAFLQYLAEPSTAIHPPQSLAEGATASIGAGPFQVTGHQDGVNMTLEKFEGYYGADTVLLEDIDLRFYKDGTARVNALLNGDVDLIDYVPWESFDQIESAPGLSMDATSGLYMEVQFNATEGSPFANPLVRQAVALSIDRQNIVDAAFHGHAEVLEGISLPQNSPHYTDESQHLWSHDVDKAKDLMVEAGYPDGFTTTLLTSSQYAFHQDTALSVQADLKEIGINAELNAPDYQTRLALKADCDYGLVIHAPGAMVADPSYLLTLLTGTQGSRSCGYENAELVSLLREGLTAPDEADVEAAYAEAFELIAEDTPFAILAKREQGWGKSDKVAGFANLPSVLTFYTGYSLESTYMTD